MGTGGCEWELGRHQKTPEQRHTVRMGEVPAPWLRVRLVTVGRGQGLGPAVWLRHFPVVRLSDCQCHLATIGRQDRIKLNNLISDSEVATRWQMLTRFGIFLALAKFPNPCSFLSGKAENRDSWPAFWSTAPGPWWASYPSFGVLCVCVFTPGTGSPHLCPVSHRAHLRVGLWQMLLNGCMAGSHVIFSRSFKCHVFFGMGSFLEYYSFLIFQG